MTNNNGIFLETIWEKLIQGTKNRKSAFHTLNFGYVTKDTRPRSCYVVLRKVLPTARKIYFHSDVRHKKIDCLRENPYVSACIYSKEDKLQIRITGKCTILHNTQLTHDTWSGMQNLSKICYAGDLTPGTINPVITNGYSKERWPNRFEHIHAPEAYQNFAMIEILVEEIETLYLSIEGHQRRVSTWDTTQQSWQHNWLAP